MTTSKRVKYPRTRHLPWSPGASSDDVYIQSLAGLDDRSVIVTEKMDGENTTLYRDGLHARSLDSRHHPSRDWVKSLQANIGYLIPDGWRICGENCFARHSVAYEQLPSYFLVFSIWDDNNQCLSWSETLQWCERLGLMPVPTLYDGPFNVEAIKRLSIDTHRQEGYVVRLAQSFHFDAFNECVAKWVRAEHVQTDKHWMHQAITPNGLRRPS